MSAPAPRLATELPGVVALAPRWSALPAVTVRVDGVAEGDFVLDTGAAITVVDRVHAERWGLEVVPLDAPLEVTRGGAPSGRLVARARVGRLELGDAAIVDLAPPVAELSTFEPRLAGLVGQDALGQWALLLAPGEIRLAPPSAVPALVEELGPGAVALPTASWRGVPTVAVELAGTTWRMVVDSGSTMTSLPAAAVAALALEPRYRTTRVHVGGSEQAEIFLCHDLRLGPFELDVAVDSEPVEVGLLGYDVLGRFRAVPRSGRRATLAGAGPRLGDEDPRTADRGTRQPVTSVPGGPSSPW